MDLVSQCCGVVWDFVGKIWEIPLGIHGKGMGMAADLRRIGLRVAKISPFERAVMGRA